MVTSILPLFSEPNQNQALEEWRTVPGHPTLEASSLGRVRRQGRGRNLKPYPNSCGYLRIKIRQGGVFTNKTVASIVAETFIGPRPQGFTINHIDGVKANNSSTNLEYVTMDDNHKHYQEVLRPVRMILHPNKPKWARTEQMLHPMQIRVIRHLLASRMSQREIGIIFGKAPQTISAINCGIAWKSV